MSELPCAKILVKLDERVLPKIVKIVVGSSSFSLQLWWQILHCLGLAEAGRVSEAEDVVEVRDEPFFMRD